MRGQYWAGNIGRQIYRLGANRSNNASAKQKISVSNKKKHNKEKKTFLMGKNNVKHFVQGHTLSLPKGMD